LGVPQIVKIRLDGKKFLPAGPAAREYSASMALEGMESTWLKKLYAIYMIYPSAIPGVEA